MASQLGRPKLVGDRSPVIASVSASALLSCMFITSSGLILAVRYCSTTSQLHPSKVGQTLDEWTYRVNLDMTVHVLRLDSTQEALEPLEAPEIPTHPEEIDLAEPRFLLGVVHPVPDTLQDAGEWCNSDACTHQYRDFIFENVFGG